MRVGFLVLSLDAKQMDVGGDDPEQQIGFGFGEEVDRILARRVFHERPNAQLEVDFLFKPVHKRAQAELSLVVDKTDRLRTRLGETGSVLEQVGGKKLGDGHK